MTHLGVLVGSFVRPSWTATVDAYCSSQSWEIQLYNHNGSAPHLVGLYAFGKLGAALECRGSN